MELTIEHLAPYLKHKIEVAYEEGAALLAGLNIEGEETAELTVVKLDENERDIYYKEEVTLDEIKPLLRPLSQLTQEVTHNGETFCPAIKILESNGFNIEVYSDKELSDWKDTILYEFKNLFSATMYSNAQLAISWHFDVYNLIENGLAIELSTNKE